MSEDLYTKILEIAPGERPPNYYQLLGLTLFETDRRTIHQAGKAQFLKLRPWQAHRDRAVSEQISELFSLVSRACTILEVPEKKVSYDRELSERLGVSLDNVAPPPPPSPKPTKLTLKGRSATEEDLGLRTCPHCGAKASSLAMLCIECGFSFETGKKLQTFIDGEAEENEVKGLAPSSSVVVGRASRLGFFGILAKGFEIAYKLATYVLFLVVAALVVGGGYWAFSTFAPGGTFKPKPYKMDASKATEWAKRVDASKTWTSVFDACAKSGMKGPPYLVFMEGWSKPGRSGKGRIYTMDVRKPDDNNSLAKVKFPIKCKEHWDQAQNHFNALAERTANSLASSDENWARAYAETENGKYPLRLTR